MRITESIYYLFSRLYVYCYCLRKTITKLDYIAGDSNLEAVVQGLEDYKIQENGSGAFVGIITKTDIVKAICGLKNLLYVIDLLQF